VTSMDLRAFREQFPALERYAWLNTPTVPPGNRPSLEAVRRVVDEWERGEFSWQAWEGQAHQTRDRFAALLGVDPGQIALIHALVEGTATVAASLPPGKVVVGAEEFRSNLFPWLALRERGFEVVEVPPRDGVVPTDALAAEVDEGTVLLAVSEVQSSNGYRVDVPALADRCRDVGARIFVNLTQCLGALRFDRARSDPDYVAAHGYKWLLGPRAAGWLYVRPDRLPEVQPLAPNWKSVPDPYEDYYGGPMELAPDARKLDTSLAWFAWPGALAALDLLRSLDPEAVERRCLELAAAFRQGARDRGFRLVPEELPSQTVALDVPDPDGLRERLGAQDVVGAVRSGRLRLGFHAFNDEGDVDRALEALGRP
jgi:selenocysteine lyase/cysteine desulfurase